MERYNKNGINILIEQASATPRISVAFFFKVDKKEKYFGVNSLLARLFLQGTKNYSALELADMFERECIDISTKSKQDYIKISLSFLNEDFEHAMELLNEIVINSDFSELEKEKFKIKGEINSDLDNPRTKLYDKFIKTMFKNHPYSYTLTKILDDIDKITKQDIIDAHKLMLNSNKTISIAGDFSDIESVLNFLEKKFPYMKSYESNDEIEDIFKNDIEDDKILFIEKNDAAQAQIVQGWLVESFNSKACAKYAVLNNILGSSGLSSRLFVNLRDKQGLAYNVRSQYETMLHSAIFSLYIGCDPKNIEKSLNGFRDEIQKLASTPPSERELIGAYENISGRLKYFSQNNSQIASMAGDNYILGLGLDYKERFLKSIKQVTAQDVSNIAQHLLSLPSLSVVIAPSEYRIEK